MKRAVFLFFVLLGFSGPLPVHAQYPYRDYTKVDSFARTVKYDNDLIGLAKKLTDPYTDEADQARSLFIWITHNVRYDYKFFNAGKEVGPPECKPRTDCGKMYLEWEKAYLKKVAKKGKAVCDGYARLFDRLCEMVGIRSAMIEGYTKTKPYQVGSPGTVNHAWNAVWLDSAWYLLDPTWAAGYCTEDPGSGLLTGFVRSYDNYYWCTPFDEFTRNHYPKSGKWVFEPNYTKEKFAENPYYDPDLISEIRLLSPASGVIRAALGDTLHFRFTYTGDIRKMQLNSNTYRNPDLWTEKRSRRKVTYELDSFALKRQRYVTFVRKDNEYSFDYVITDQSLYYLEILFDNQRKAMRFRVKMKEEE